MVRLLHQNGSSHEDGELRPARSDLGDIWHRESNWSGGVAFDECEEGGASAQHKVC